MKAINAPFADKLRLPRVPKRRKRVFKKAHIQQLIKQIEQLKCKSLRLRTKAAVLLAATSGLRSSEIYQLTLSDIDFENRIVLVNFGKTAGTSRTIKDFEERFSFFSIEARTAIEEYIDNYKSSTPSTPRLFPESSIRRAFKQLNTDLRLKHMRKFFSQ
ncbi:MAG: tyrosine-type recombinase/integrase [Archaeoglobaceae archaeon]|nr:tyrosine-type recombinase/integrase [Archaeoglobaceae archaeon]